jgi:sulfide dehydrogenase cytochrome subunit
MTSARTLPHQAFTMIITSAALILVSANTSWAQTPPPSPLQVSIWAASCMACHGPEGQAEGTGLTIGGRPADQLLSRLLAYKTGQLPATIMHQHAKGYSNDELRLISEYFANLK